ncbi:Hypothetical protein c3040 [Escherichia coli CFT073]|uniref:Uncharacterized protein n=1 Tax=Escherichia coli O6:H1 (strain CFT073 / ATCC 700928 / UPEC) TaxID=199310 RepID=A0A0H2V9H6_ECOL6|nr:Hypothetical protein c3040 [Escherichia coli CFT073]
MPRLHAAFTKLLTGARAHFAFAEEISDFASGRLDGIRTVGTIFGQAVSVISTQSTGQCVCRIGRAQQIAVTLNSIFTFQHGNNDRARSHEFNQTIKERFSIVFSIKATSLFNGQVQHFGADNFEPCSFKARKDTTNHVFCYRVRFDDGKSTFNSHFYLCKLFCCCLYQRTRWRGL